MTNELMHEKQPDVWPLFRGDTLSNHDWFPFYGHKFLGSRFLGTSLMKGKRADVGTAVILWAEAMRQDPAGTLPEDDYELASLCRFASVEEWQACRESVLHGWVPVYVEDEQTGVQVIRLGHPSFMQGIVEQMHRRKKGRDGAREAGNLATKKSRIKKKMVEARIPDHIINDDRAMDLLVAYFDASDLYITKDNLKQAMVEAIGFNPSVTHFPKAAT